MTIVCTVILLTSFAMVAGAMQRRTLAGTWTVKLDVAPATETNSDAQTREVTAGTLVLELKDTAISGTWAGTDGQTWSIAGEVKTSKFEWIARPKEMQPAGNGGQAAAKHRWRFRGENDHDTLRGTITLEREGDDGTPSRTQPFVATRRP